jgi:uncharacterized membrane protein
MPGTVRRRHWVLVVAYVPILGVFPLLVGNASREERWHARNGLLLLVGFLGVLAVATFAGILFPSLSCVSGILLFALAVIYGIVLILAMVKALQGERLMIPGLSEHADRG